MYKYKEYLKSTTLYERDAKELSTKNNKNSVT